MMITAGKDRMASERFCEICRENLRTKNGSFVAMVSLFCETSNKEFSSALSGKPVILAKLLADLGIVVVQDCQHCLQKVRKEDCELLQAVYRVTTAIRGWLG